MGLYYTEFFRAQGGIYNNPCYLFHMEHSPDSDRDFVRERMAKRGITQVGLADAVGCSQPLISQWLSGQRELGDETIVRLCKTLDVDQVTLIQCRMRRKVAAAR